MTEPAHTSPLPVVRLQWGLVQPLLAVLSEARVPLRPGDLEQLQHAATIGPEFAHALARWIRDAHTAAEAPVRRPADVRALAPRPERPALGGPGPAAVADRHAS
ncbi:hypothetical protein [Kitasatospora cineracea]|uniref:Uncharacterized protein n=1 Tax=Kitasatospora cineracea TaxID=88074 RepID=A0A3N4RUL3_9ACTN|nr:hypothetical protein [Kitasatospora cineracea]ROR46210.1 hypothetical protein EDD39_4470 [Kitasatospora cineracea]RPE36586.1 hypothetical protein EDD38_4962 [Kitasatospora cineracea]